MIEVILSVLACCALISMVLWGIYLLDENRINYVFLVHKHEGNFFKVLLQSYFVNKKFHKFYVKSKAVYNISILSCIEYWCREVISDTSKYILEFNDNKLTIKHKQNSEKLTIVFDSLGISVNNVDLCIIPPYYAFLISKVLDIQKNIIVPVPKNKFDK